MSELARFMGHDDDRTTQKHYARYSPGYLSKVANAVKRQPKKTAKGSKWTFHPCLPGGPPDLERPDFCGF